MDFHYSVILFLWYVFLFCVFFVTVLFLCSCSTPSRHMDLSISVMNISRQHCSWMKSRQISGWISPSSGLQRGEEEENRERYNQTNTDVHFTIKSTVFQNMQTEHFEHVFPPFLIYLMTNEQN